MNISLGRGARRVAKAPYVGYYRFLYGRRFPGSAQLRLRVERLELRLQHGDTPAGRDMWEQKFATGRWTYMRDLHERPRYAAVASIVNGIAGSSATVLDVGCGEGLLVDHLRPLGYDRYLGIDIAISAVTAAESRNDEHTAFVTGDAEQFSTGEEAFDVIVFNECLCYFREPERTLTRYEEFLRTGGSFVLSTFRTPRHDAMVRRVAARYRLIEQFELQNRLGRSGIRVLVPITGTVPKSPPARGATE